MNITTELFRKNIFQLQETDNNEQTVINQRVINHLIIRNTAEHDGLPISIWPWPLKSVFPPSLTALPSKTAIKPPQVSEQRIKPNELEEEIEK